MVHYVAICKCNVNIPLNRVDLYSPHSNCLYSAPSIKHTAGEGEDARDDAAGWGEDALDDAGLLDWRELRGSQGMGVVSNS